MPPEATASETAVSADVCTVTLTEPAVALPITNPDNVTTNAEGGTAAPAVVITTDVVVEGAHVAVSPATLLLPAGTVGVDVAKKAVGKLNVMVPAIGSSVDSVKPRVTGTAAFATMRSDEATVNETAETCPLITPEETESEAAVSEDVCTFTPTAPAVTAPIRKPDIVTTKATAGIAAAAVVMTTEVAPVAPHVPVRAATLLLPADIAVGVMDAAKKPDG
jgi:hypothetical protein